MKHAVTIGMDVDGVLRNFAESLVEIYRLHYPKHQVTPIKDWKQYALEGYFPIGTDIYKFFTEEHPLVIYSQARPYPAVRGQLSDLREKNRIVTVSYQPSKHIEELTMDWLRHYGLLGVSEIFVKDKSKVKGLDLLVDDCTENLEGVRRAATTTIPVCMDRPWNQDWTGVRVSSLKEVEYFVTDLKRQGFFE